MNTDEKGSMIGCLYAWADCSGGVMTWFRQRAGLEKDGELTYDQEIAARKAVAEIAKPLVIADLESLGFYGISIRWSRKAGCSCGCSPAYVINAKDLKPKTKEASGVWSRIMGLNSSQKKALIGYIAEGETIRRDVNHHREYHRRLRQYYMCGSVYNIQRDLGLNPPPDDKEHEHSTTRVHLGTLPGYRAENDV